MIFPMFTSRLSWHGWPTHPALADIMGWKLDASRLQKAHELVGSGWMLPCSFSALMSFLATVELSEDCGTKTVPRSLPVSPEWELVRVPQIGRCFLACLALGGTGGPGLGFYIAQQCFNADRPCYRICGQRQIEI